MDQNITLTKTHLQIFLGAILFLVVLNLAGFISGLVAIDDDPTVWRNNWGKYAYLIILSIIYMVLGLGLVAGLGLTMTQDLPFNSLKCAIQGTGFSCNLGL